MVNTWEDVEAMCGTLKHCPEQVNLSDVRSLFRRCQFEIETLRTLMASATFPGAAVLHALNEVSE